MLISVVIPSYNRSELVVRAIESVLAQTYPEIEIVVVDDGSTDDTGDVIAAISSRVDRPVRYSKKVNGGCASARNAGIKLAKGVAIAFLDSDDLWQPDAAESLAKALLKEGADFSYSPAFEVYKDRTEVNLPVAAGQPENFAVEHFMNSNVHNGSLLFKREVFDSVGLLDETLKHNEDSDFVQRVAICCKAAYCDVPTVRVFHHATNKSGNRVALLRAVLKSAEKILVAYPEFALRLGALAGKRLSTIKGNLVEALIVAGDFVTAQEMAGAAGKEIRLSARLALWTGSPFPVKLASMVQMYTYFLSFHIGRLFKKEVF